MKLTLYPCGVCMITLYPCGVCMSSRRVSPTEMVTMVDKDMEDFLKTHKYRRSVLRYGWELLGTDHESRHFDHPMCPDDLIVFDSGTCPVPTGVRSPYIDRATASTSKVRLGQQ